MYFGLLNMSVPRGGLMHRYRTPHNITKVQRCPNHIEPRHKRPPNRRCPTTNYLP